MPARWSTTPRPAQTVLRGQGEMHLNGAVDRLTKASGLKVSDAAAAGAVPRDDPAAGDAACAAEAADGRARAVRRREAGDHAAGARRGLPVQRQDRRRRRAAAAISPRSGRRRRRRRKGPLGHPGGRCRGRRWWTATFHAVDSSDMAFKTATRMAMQEGLAKADPVLLEPIDHVSISVPSEYTAERAAADHRPARADPGLCGAGGLAGVGRCGGADAAGGAAGPDHRSAVADDGVGDVSA